MLFNIDINFDSEDDILDYWDNDNFEDCCSFSNILKSEGLKEKLISKLKKQNKEIKINQKENIIQKNKLKKID